MKGLLWIIIGLSLILLAIYIVISDESTSPAVKTYIVGGDDVTGKGNIKTFIVEQGPTGRSMLIQGKRETQDIRERWIRYEQIDEEVNKCIDQITKNWERTYVKKSYEKVYDGDEEEWILTNTFYETERSFYGYDEDEDFRLRWRLRNRALDGEEIC